MGYWSEIQGEVSQDIGEAVNRRLGSGFVLDRISVSPGSLDIRFTWLALLTAYNLIANYAAFKEGVGELGRDVGRIIASAFSRHAGQVAVSTDTQVMPEPLLVSQPSAVLSRESRLIGWSLASIAVALWVAIGLYALLQF